jgi:hypothetical protein
VYDIGKAFHGFPDLVSPHCKFNVDLMTFLSRRPEQRWKGTNHKSDVVVLLFKMSELSQELFEQPSGGLLSTILIELSPHHHDTPSDPAGLIGKGRIAGSEEFL